MAYPIGLLILNITSTNTFFPIISVIGMVRLRTSFILSSLSWEIGNPLTGSAGRMDWVAPAAVTCIWPVHTPRREALHLNMDVVCVSIHFAQVEEVWWSYPELVRLFLKECQVPVILLFWTVLYIAFLLFWIFILFSHQVSYKYLVWHPTAVWRQRVSCLAISVVLYHMSDAIYNRK